ncbi:hypothetical protein ALTERO38_51547 [Alteromonas sp. 38]|nr:hypothetical protein ALTER154_80091 [Alteromonas sp. 154]VXB77770.1 hypothetical protein ALTERO38_51547 [Alteromonas sp. 38]
MQPHVSGGAKYSDKALPMRMITQFTDQNLTILLSLKVSLFRQRRP